MGLVLPPGLAKVTTDASLTGAGTAASPLRSLATSTVVDVTAASYGADRTGVADSWAAITAAVTAAKANSKDLYIPPGKYKSSKYIDINGARGLRIIGTGATIVYPSDDTSVAADSIATTINQARSAFFIRNSRDVTIEGLVFQGGTNVAFDTVNVGCGAYATRCQNLRHISTTQNDGASLHQQDAQPNTSAPGDSITVSAGVVTLVCSFASFRADMVGRELYVFNATNQLNNGVFIVASYVSPTTITFKNTTGITETSQFHWEVDDGDRTTIMTGVVSNRARGVITLPNYSSASQFLIRQPIATRDFAGIPTQITAGSPVTLSAVNGDWDSSIGKRYVLVSGSTSSANDGLFPIIAATPKSRFAPATITYTNASAVTETGSRSGYFCIFGGEHVGIGAGAGALAKSVSTMTLTGAAGSFHAGMVGHALRIAKATSAANNGAFTITAFISSTQIQYTNTAGVAETFVGVWSTDQYDATGPSGAAYGSSHGFYIFAGRTGIDIGPGKFIGVRKNCVKASGSSSPIRDVNVHDIEAIECGALGTFGADDSQEHTNLHCDRSILTDVGTGRPGWGEGVAITFLGSKGGSAKGNQFHYTRPAISAVDGRATQAGLYGVLAARYVAGKTQPIEDFDGRDNRFTADRVNTVSSLLLSAGVHAERIGQTAYWGGNSTSIQLTNNAGVMTLQDSTAAFSQDLVGSTIHMYGMTSTGNRGVFIVASVTGTSSLTYVNASGVTEAFPASGSSYRIKRPVGARGGSCRLSGIYCDGAASSAVETISCVAPDLRGITWNSCGGINEGGSLSPLIDGHREIAALNSNAGIKLTSATAWPLVGRGVIASADLSGGGTITSGSLTPEKPAAVRRDVGIGVDSGAVVDHPLLGFHGRAAATGGRAELMIAFGSELVEGDTFSLNGAAYTYTDSPSPSYPKFHTFAQLIAISTGSGYTAADYGSRFAVPVVTGHMAVYLTAPNATANQGYIDTVNVLNPTALVIPRDDVAAGESIQYSRGEALAGPADKQLAIWSPYAAKGGVFLSADNSAAAAAIVGGYFVPPVAGNAGAVNVVQFVATQGAGAEYRWSLP